MYARFVLGFVWWFLRFGVWYDVGFVGWTLMFLIWFVVVSGCLVCWLGSCDFVVVFYFGFDFGCLVGLLLSVLCYLICGCYVWLVLVLYCCLSV